LPVVEGLLAAAACSGAADTPSTLRSTQPPHTPTGTVVTVPAFDRGRLFAAVIPIPGARSLAVARGKLWVLDAASTVVGIDPATNTAAGKPLRIPADSEASPSAVGPCGSPASPLGASARQATTR
jgi:hypothetical protein